MLSQPPLWLILVAFLAALGPLIIVHELGHYWVARLFGVGAETFSIGFGREIAGWTDKRGTRWKVGWLPLGGYVKFVGDADAVSMPGDVEDVAPEDRRRSFHLRPVWQRFLIVLAGPVANFLLAILIFAAFFATFGAPPSNTVGKVTPNSAAAAAGLQPGDRILAVGGRSTPTFEDIYTYVLLRPGQKVELTISRDGDVQKRPATLGVDVLTDEYGQKFERGLLGITPSSRALERVSAVEAVPLGAVYTVKLTRSSIDALGQIITGQRSVKEIGGPLKIAQIAGQRANLGLLQFIQLVALISINLGFINLLPVPMLDGGHLALYTIEAVRRRPVSLQAQEWAFRGGLAILLALLLFTTLNDLGSFGLWDRVGRLIG
jgi:regulator of sigma E protease